MTIMITQFYDPQLNQVIVIEENGTKFVLEYQWPDYYSNKGYTFVNAPVTSPQFPGKTWNININLDTAANVEKAFQELLLLAQGDNDAGSNI